MPRSLRVDERVCALYRDVVMITSVNVNYSWLTYSGDLTCARCCTNRRFNLRKFFACYTISFSKLRDVMEKVHSRAQIYVRCGIIENLR
jgi:hypothetical protein